MAESTSRDGAPASRATRCVVIRGGTVVDAGGEQVADVVIRGAEVVEVGAGVAVPRGATVLDAGGCLVAPGLVDLHTHLRQPGAEDAETVESGARAAALGGFTAVVAMPNTDPPVDSAAVALEVLSLGAGAMCQVAVAGAITMGRAGERLAPIGELASLGVRLFTDDGAGVQDVSVMRRALEYARGFDVTLAQHCEDEALACGGHMHEGEWSSRLGVPGIPAEAEEMMVARDIALARLTGGRVHFLHISTARSAALVQAAKAQGLAVTAEVTPHHLSLTHAELSGYDPVYKVNPPLRAETDLARAARRLRGRESSTPSPPTTRRTLPSARTPPSTPPPRGCSGSRPRSRWCSAPWVGTTVAMKVVDRAATTGPATGPRRCRRATCSASCHGVRRASPGSLRTRAATREGPSRPARPPTSVSST